MCSLMQANLKLNGVNMQKVKSLVAATILLVSGHAVADNTSLYAGGGLGLTEFSDYDREVGGKLYGGVGINKSFAIEAGYARVRSTDTFGSEELEAIDNVFFASPVFRLPVTSKANFIGKLNVAWHKYKVDDVDNCVTTRRATYCDLVEISDDEFKAGFGLGGEFKLNRMVTLRAEYETFASDVKMVTAGATVSF